MADRKITELTELTTPVSDDVSPSSTVLKRQMPTRTKRSRLQRSTTVCPLERLVLPLLLSAPTVALVVSTALQKTKLVLRPIAPIRVHSHPAA